jgi:hypothetical protein
MADEWKTQALAGAALRASYKFLVPKPRLYSQEAPDIISVEGADGLERVAEAMGSSTWRVDVGVASESWVAVTAEEVLIMRDTYVEAFGDTPKPNVYIGRPEASHEFP